MKRTIPSGISICLLISSLVLIPSVTKAFPNSPKTIKVNQDIIRGIELLYDWEFDQAEKIFYKVTAENPKNPMGYFYLAMVSWSQLASGFWSPKIVQRYGKRIDQAIDIARKKIEEGNPDSFDYFYLGGALGFKGRFQLMERKWLSSFFLALEAIDALKTCQKMDPKNRDVLFGLGIFDYYSAKLSGVLKFLSYLLLHKGDIEEGLRKLNVATNEALYSSVEAKSLLIHIYLFLENAPHKALPLVQEMAQRFKNNPRNKHLEGMAYILLGKQREYKSLVSYFFQRSREEKGPERAAIWQKRALYLETSYHLLLEQYPLARLKLESILSEEDPEKDPFMIGWPLVKMGMSYDAEDDREQALKYYKRVTSLENGAGAQFLAEKYTENPARKKDPFLAY
ncbi:MAG: hypothetical protein ABII26_04515 [Pseudomonadota bacterium]